MERKRKKRGGEWEKHTSPISGEEGDLLCYWRKNLIKKEMADAKNGN